MEISNNSLIGRCRSGYYLTGVIAIPDIADIDHLYRFTGCKRITDTEITYNTAYILALIRLHDRA